MTIDRSEDEKPEAASRSRLGKRPLTASEQLEELLGYPWPFPGRPPKHDLSTWTVTDDWPNPVPVTEAEIEDAVARIERVCERASQAPARRGAAR